MPQITFGDIEYLNHKRKTKRECFLEQMEKVIPWGDWVKLIEAHYPSGKRGRPPRGIEKMLRMYLMQLWFNLSDEGVEEAIYDSRAMQAFMRINFLEEQVPDATTLLKFRHLLEEHKIGAAIFDDIKARLDDAGLIFHGGTIVDASIMEAPSSTKNEKKERDPEMHQTKKGDQWHFGMKVHIGVDAESGYVHTITGTPANVHDVTEAHNLVRKDDTEVYGDSGYTGLERREEIKDDPHLSNIEYHINRRPSSIKKLLEEEQKQARAEEKEKSSIRSKVEHMFLIVKGYFGYSKVVYRGIAKNMNRYLFLFGFANFVKALRSGQGARLSANYA